MKKFTKFLLVPSFLLFMAGVQAQTWTIYDASALPENSTPAWAQGDKGTALPTYTIVDDNGNGTLVETTAASADKMSYKLNVTQPTSGTWIIRTKAGLTNPSSMEFEMNAIDGTATTKYRINFKLWNNAKGGYLMTNYLTTNVAFPTDSNLTVQQYHLYRVTVTDGQTFKIYVDENPIAAVTGTGSSTTNSQFLRFGDVGSNFSEGTIDWMAWDATGAYAPGEGTMPVGVITRNLNISKSEITVYPNPVSNLLQVTNAADLKNYEIYDLSGKVVKKGVNSESTFKISINDLESGNYILKMYSKTSSEKIKFIKK